MFTFIFHLYNFLGSMKDLHAKLSKDFSWISLSLLGLTNQMPTYEATQKSRRDGSTGTSSSSRLQMQSKSFPALRGQTLVLIKVKGYDLLPEDDQ